MNQTKYNSAVSNAAFLNYAFVNMNSMTFHEVEKNYSSSLEGHVEYNRVNVYCSVRKLQKEASLKCSDESKCLDFVEKRLNLQPNTAQKYIATYLPFYDPADPNKFEFKWYALTTLGVGRLKMLAPIVTQLFANPDADFCRNFWITEWSIEILTGNDPNKKSSWCDARKINANDIPNYYHLANLDPNGKPLPLPEPIPVPASIPYIEITDDDIDLDAMFD